MKTKTATGALAFWAIATLGYAQQTVNGGITVLGPLRSNGSLAAVDFTGAGSTSPVKSGPLASRPGACIVGQMYFATDATPGQNLSYCTPPGTWSTSSGSGAGPCQLASSLGFALNGSDETALLNSTLAAFFSAGGGCLAINAGKTLRADGQIVLPNSGMGGGLTQPTYRFTSAGNAGGWGDTTTSISQGVLDLRFHGDSSHPEYGTGPKLLTLGNGQVIFDNLTITTGAGTSDCAAYMMTTSSMLIVHNVTFLGPSNPWSSCNTGIVLGGTTWNNAAPNGNVTDHFAGYGTTIRDNRFLQMGRAIWARSAVNAVLIDNNFIQGGNHTTPPNAIDIIGYNGSVVDASRGNVISNNTIELGSGGYGRVYACGINLQYANTNQIFGNSFWDGDGTTYALCGDGTAIQNNIDRTNFVDSTGSKLVNANWSGNNYMPWRTIPFFFDGGGQALSGTITRCGRVPFGGQINQFSMASDQAGSATVTVKAASFGSYAGPSSTTDISNGGETMTSSAMKQDTTLTGWSYTGGTNILQPNSILCFTLSGASGITWLGGDVQVWEGR